MTEVANLVPKGSFDLIKLSWEETEATADCALDNRTRYRLVTIETAARAKYHCQLNHSV